MGLREIGAKLPPGFRFYPSDEELVCHYLYNKITNTNYQDALKPTLMEIDLHICEPWQLPEVAKLNSSEWYFFNFRDRKYATGYRTNRATKSGYWKATGKDRTVVDSRTGAIVGMRKTLVFYKNRAPNGIKSGWIMHEFRLENPLIPPKEDWVLCRVFYKPKGDNSKELSPENIIAGDTSPNMDASPPLTAACCHQTTTTTTNSSASSHQSPPLHHHNQDFIGLSLQHYNCNCNPNFLLSQNEVLKEYSMDEMIISSSDKCKDEYGFLFDMGFQNEVPSHLQDLGLGDYDNDDGIVFF